MSADEFGSGGFAKWKRSRSKATAEHPQSRKTVTPQSRHEWPDPPMSVFQARMREAKAAQAPQAATAGQMQEAAALFKAAAAAARLPATRPQSRVVTSYRGDVLPVRNLGRIVIDGPCITTFADCQAAGSSAASSSGLMGDPLLRDEWERFSEIGTPVTDESWELGEPQSQLSVSGDEAQSAAKAPPPPPPEGKSTAVAEKQIIPPPPEPQSTAVAEEPRRPVKDVPSSIPGPPPMPRKIGRGTKRNDAQLFSEWKDFTGPYRQHNAAAKYFRHYCQKMGIDEYPLPNAAVAVKTVVHAVKGPHYSIDENMEWYWNWLELVAQLDESSRAIVVGTGHVTSCKFAFRDNKKHPTRKELWDFIITRADGTAIRVHPEWQGTKVPSTLIGSEAKEKTPWPPSGTAVAEPQDEQPQSRNTKPFKQYRDNLGDLTLRFDPLRNLVKPKAKPAAQQMPNRPQAKSTAVAAEPRRPAKDVPTTIPGPPRTFPPGLSSKESGWGSRREARGNRMVDQEWGTGWSTSG